MNSSPFKKLETKSFPKPQVSKPQVSKPIKNPKTNCPLKTNFSKSINIKSKDVKGKGKIVSKPESSLKEYEASLKRKAKEFAKRWLSNTKNLNKERLLLLN